jgi:hypothetical protein
MKTINGVVPVIPEREAEAHAGCLIDQVKRVVERTRHEDH